MLALQSAKRTIRHEEKDEGERDGPDLAELALPDVSMPAKEAGEKGEVLSLNVALMAGLGPYMAVEGSF